MTLTSPPPPVPFRVRTIYSWGGSEEDDLGFIEGDIIEVDDLGDGNWWHGRLRRNKMAGNFPSNYVEIIRVPIPTSSVTPSAGSPATVKSHGRSTSPSSPYSKSSYSKSRMARSTRLQDIHRENSQEDDSEMQFSFQSSQKYYKNPKVTQSSDKFIQSSNISSNYELPHSRSVPTHLPLERGYTHQPRRGSREPSPPFAQSSAQSSAPRGYSYGPSAPPIPQHSVPVKSKSSMNLPTVQRHASPPEVPVKDSFSRSGNTRQPQQPPHEFVLPYDPETLNQSKSASGSQCSNVFSYSNGSYFTDSQSSSQSTFAMSDFSATSAGSYSRHKWEEQQRASAKSQSLNTSASGNNLLVDDKKIKHSGGILKKFFSTKDAPPLPSMEQMTRTVNDLAVNDEKMNSWIEFKIDLNRANSLSAKERQVREKRVRENEGYIILEPHKQLSTINSNECIETDHKMDLDSISLKHVDNFVRQLKVQTNIMSPDAFITNEFAMKFSSKLEYLRALFVLCAESFTIKETKAAANKDIGTNVDELFYHKTGTPFEMAYLFKYMCDSIGLKAELIEGSLKTPRAIVRHFWNGVLINGEWRLIDVSMGNLANPIYDILPNKTEESNESFYFLAEPLNLIYTHIPDKYEHQHIIPPIDPMAALALPPCFPSFFKNGLKIHKFSNALTRLEGFEIFEVDLKIPKDIEVNAIITTKSEAVNTLAQVYWKHNERYCKIKGHLPANSSVGFVNIFSGLRGVQKSLQNIHPLSMVIPITHSGDFRPLDFVIRYPTVHSQLNDLYIKQPQNLNLAYGAEYVFSILQHPSKGINPSGRTKIALQSPSGKIHKFVKKDDTTPFGTWDLPIKCNETGVWRGLVSIDTGTSLCVFAEWVCQH